MLKEGDFVTVKDGIELESKEKTENWGGQVLEIYEKQKTFLLKLDSITLKSMSDKYLLDCLETGGEHEYVFNITDLELSQRRDTEEELEMAMEEISSRMSALGGESVYEEELYQSWITEFGRSPLFETLSEYQKENAGFIIDTFLGYMYNYEYILPNDWEPENIGEVCLNIVPRKVTAEAELFENYGDVLIQFLKFIGEKNYIQNSTELQKAVLEIKDEIPKIASDPMNWGMAKSMMMGATDSGVDLSDQNQLDEYIMGYNRNLKEQLNPSRAVIRPLRKTPLKKIGRNQKITVKYKDGRIVENIKFKKVEKDLMGGNCELVEP